MSKLGLRDDPSQARAQSRRRWRSLAALVPIPPAHDHADLIAGHRPADKQFGGQQQDHMHVQCGQPPIVAIRKNTPAVGAHLTKTGKTRKTAIDGRTTRHPGYAISQRIRKRIEEGFGYIKTVAVLRKTRHRGTARVGFMFTLAAAAYNLVRIPKLLATIP